MTTEAPKIIFGPVEDTNQLLMKWGKGTRWSGVTKVNEAEILVIADEEAIGPIEQDWAQKGIIYATHADHTLALATELYNKANLDQE